MVLLGSGCKAHEIGFSRILLRQQQLAWLVLSFSDDYLEKSNDHYRAERLDAVRQVEEAGAAVNLTRRGKVVARLVPTVPAAHSTPPWLCLRGTGTLSAKPEESVLDATQFEAGR